MSDVNAMPAAETAATKLFDLIGGCWTSQAIGAAAQLGIADLMADGCESVHDLARAAKCHPESLRSLLRSLATLDLCVEADDGSYTLTSTGRLLRSDDPSSVHACAIWWGRYLWPLWGELVESIRSGRSVRELRTGATGFAHVESDPQAAAVFNRAMTERTRHAAVEIMRVCDFTSVRRLIDVGGGHGELVIQLLVAYPALRAVVFDLPHAVGLAAARIDAAGLGERSECVAGSFLEAVPAGADAYVLKSVVHNWNDEDALRILKNCRRAMAVDGRLMLVERVKPRRAGRSALDQALARTDLNMLIGVGGRERSRRQFHTLLRNAGFDSVRFSPTAMELCIIEASPA
jgi:orsellinic acid C2-O-methyltransferase